MNLGRSRYFRWTGKQELLLLVFMLVMVRYYSYATATYTFPENLPFFFVFPIVIIIALNIRFGIILWYLLSVMGCKYLIDLPGIPPLPTPQLILLLMLGIWCVSSYKAIPSAIGSFLSTGKNRILLILLGWITLSMIVGRLTGVTQMNVKYQFNAWLCYVLAIATPVFISYYFSERLIRNMIWIMVCVGILVKVVTIAVGLSQGVGLLGWVDFVQEFNYRYMFVDVSHLFLALLFLSYQNFWGKVLFSVAILVSLTLSILLILSGHRSTTLWLVSTLGFILLLTRPRLLIVLSLVVVLPFLLLNIPLVKSWTHRNIEYTVTTHGLVFGEGARIAYAKDGIEIMKKHPIWGTGSDFYRLYGDLRPKRESIYGAPTAHNSWVQVAVDHGIPALVLLVIFCGYLTRDCIHLFRSLKNQFLKRFLLFFSSSVFSKIVSSFISSGIILPVFTGTPGGGMVVIGGVFFSFWFFYGILLGIEKEQAKRNSTAGASRIS